jgi:hypothetical protein
MILLVEMTMTLNPARTLPSRVPLESIKFPNALVSSLPFNRIAAP